MATTKSTAANVPKNQKKERKWWASEECGRSLQITYLKNEREREKDPEPTREEEKERDKKIDTTAIIKNQYFFVNRSYFWCHLIFFFFWVVQIRMWMREKQKIDKTKQ